VNSLANFLNWCRGRSYVAENVADGITRHKVSKQAIPETLSLAQCRDLMNHVESHAPQFVCYYALALFAGIRTDVEGSELTRLLAVVRENGWGKYRINGSVIWVPETKNGPPRQAYLPANAAEWLERFGKDPQTPSPVHFRQIAKALKLPPNGLRHTAISCFVSAGHNLAEAAVYFGNSESIIRRHYLNLWSHEDAREFYEIRPSQQAGAQTPQG
jgi:hypothetical protein